MRAYWWMYETDKNTTGEHGGVGGKYADDKPCRATQSHQHAHQ
ncbi:hypothetical protein [Moraxella lacunata]